MISASTTWTPGAVATLVAQSWAGIVRAVLHLHNALTLALNTSAGPRRVKRSRTTAAGGSSYTVYDNPAAKGDPPHKRTGWLQRHVKYELDKKAMTARVGLAVGAMYGLFHELHDHPWLLSTLKRELPAMRALLAARS